MGAVLQQRVDEWQPLAFSKKQPGPAEIQRLRSRAEAVKHFRQMLEAHHIIIFTDHMSITYAFQQKGDNCSPGSSTTSISYSNSRLTYDIYGDVQKIYTHSLIVNIFGTK
jgi:hypothetical protein